MPLDDPPNEEVEDIYYPKDRHRAEGPCAARTRAERGGHRARAWDLQVHRLVPQAPPRAPHRHALQPPLRLGPRPALLRRGPHDHRVPGAVRIRAEDVHGRGGSRRHHDPPARRSGRGVSDRGPANESEPPEEPPARGRAQGEPLRILRHHRVARSPARNGPASRERGRAGQPPPYLRRRASPTTSGAAFVSTTCRASSGAPCCQGSAVRRTAS